MCRRCSRTSASGCTVCRTAAEPWEPCRSFPLPAKTAPSALAGSGCPRGLHRKSRDPSPYRKRRYSCQTCRLPAESRAGPAWRQSKQTPCRNSGRLSGLHRCVHPLLHRKRTNPYRNGLFSGKHGCLLHQKSGQNRCASHLPPPGGE